MSSKDNLSRNRNSLVFGKFNCIPLPDNNESIVANPLLKYSEESEGPAVLLSEMENPGSEKENYSSLSKYLVCLSEMSLLVFRSKILTTFRTGFILTLLIWPWISNQTKAQTFTQPFTSSGSFIPLPGVTSVSVQCWGAGGGGSTITSSSLRGGGGGGGAFASSSGIPVTAGNNYAVVVGSGGAASSPGGNSSFNGAAVVAAGGSGGANNNITAGAGGTIANSTGTTRWAGGNGAAGGGTYSGGGGGGAGTTGPGGTAPTAAVGSFGTGTSLNGGNGGASVSGGSNGAPGNTYGGGGSGASTNSSTDRNGGSGAKGYVVITWTCTGVDVSNFNFSVTSVCAGNASVVTVTSSTLANGTYTVYYNLSNPNAASGLTATLNFSSGSGTFTTPVLATSGNTTLTITGVNCASPNNNTATIAVSTAPNPVIEFTQGRNDHEYTVTTSCGIIDGGGQNDLDIWSPNPIPNGSTFQWEESQTPTGPWNHTGLGPTSTATQFVLDPDYVNYLMVAGDYYFHLIITNNGCSGTSNVIHLHVNSSSNLLGGTIGSDQTFPCGGSVDPAAFIEITSPTGGPGNYYWQWQSSKDNINFTDITTATGRTYKPPAGLTQTTYYRRYVFSGGCRTASNVVKVTLNTVPQPGVIAGPTIVCPGSTGNVYNIAAVTGATSYNWTVPTGWAITGGASSNTITVTAGNAGQSGNISVAVVSSCGTSSPSTLPVNLSTPVSLAVQPSIVEGCTGQITLTRDPAFVTQPVTVQLIYTGTATNGTDVTPALPSVVNFLAGESNKSISFLAVADGISEGSEILNIQLSQLCSCSPTPSCSTKTLTIYDPLTITATANNVSCGSNNSGSITVSPSGGSTGIFHYSKDNGATWQTSNVFNNLAQGGYTIWAKDDGSCIDHVALIVNVDPPTYNFLANAGPDVNVCSGGTVELAGSGGLKYSWSPSVGLSDPNISNPVFSLTTPGTYTYALVVSALDGSCPSQPDNVTVTVLAVPASSITTVPASGEICNGNPITLTASGGATYLWNVVPPLTTPSIIESPASNTSYTVIVKGANGCTDNATANVVVHPLPTAVISGSADICIGNTATLVFTLTGTAPWTVTYMEGATPHVVSSNTYNYEIQVNPGSTTAYTLLSVTDATGCNGTTSGSATVTVTPVPSTPANPPPACFGWGEYVTFSINPITGVTYQWQESPDNGITWNDLIYNVWYQYWGIRDYNLMVWTPDASKNGYRYRCVVTSSCVQYSGSATLSVKETPYFDIIPKQAVYCLSSGGVTLTAVITSPDPGPYDWVWRKDGVDISGSNNNVLVVTTPGQYSAQATNRGTGCSWAHAPSTVLAAGGAVSVSISTPDLSTICSGTPVTFTAAAVYSGTPSYQWKKNGVDIPGATGAIYTDPGLTNGNIACVVTDNADCAQNNPATSNDIAITINPLNAVSVSIAANPGTIVCAGTEVTFTATPTNGGTTPFYQWIKNGTYVGSNSAIYTNAALNNGDQITCILTSNMPCATGSPATSNRLDITVNNLTPFTLRLNINTLTGDAQYCYTGSAFFIGLNNSTSGTTYWLVRDGTDIVSYLSVTNGAFNFQSQTIPGVYKVRAELNGCIAWMNYSVTVYTAAVITGQPSNSNICAGTNASFTVAATGAALSYQWQVNQGAGFGNVNNGGVYSGSTTATLNITGATAGMNGYIYQCLVTNGTCGAVASGSATLTINTAPAISTPPAPQQICIGSNATFNVGSTGTGLTYQWQEWAGSAYSNITNGGVYNGATTSTLTLTSPPPGMSGYRYRCIVSGACPSPVTSSEAMLSFFTPLVAGGLNDPTPVTACIGYNPPALDINNPVITTGSSPYSYQWQLNGANIPGATNRPYDPPQLNSPGIYNYNCIITDACNSIVSTTVKIITIVPNPTVTISGGGTLCQNAPSPLLSSTVNNGIGTITYQWQSGPSAGSMTNIPGATSATYSPSTSTSGTIYYQVIITTTGPAGCNSATSASVAVIVNPLPTTSLIYHM